MGRQAELARAHGIDGFVIHHYWFDGRRQLERPVQQLLQRTGSRRPVRPVLGERAVDPQLGRLGGRRPRPAGVRRRLGRPVLRRPRPGPGRPPLPAGRGTTAAGPLPRRPPPGPQGDGPPLARAGEGRRPPVACTSWASRPSRDFEPLPGSAGSALDGLVRFPPGSGIGLQSVAHLLPGAVDDRTGDVFSYDHCVNQADLTTQGPQGLRLHPGVMPGWDNTARRGKAAYLFHGGNPVSFRRWLARAATRPRAPRTRCCS